MMIVVASHSQEEEGLYYMCNRKGGVLKDHQNLG